MGNIYQKAASLIVFCLLLFLQMPVSAQPPSTREVPPQATYRVSVLEQQKQALESDLRERVSGYSSLPEAARSQARIDIESLLYALFDLNMSQLESQSKSLRESLRKMEQDPDYQGQASEIDRLKTSLRQVESNLTYRRQYREQIVGQRLEDLIGR